MPNDRLLRYSIAGVSFIFFIFCFQYLLGMGIPSIQVLNELAIVVSVFSVLLTAPVLGIIISTLIFQALYVIIRMKIYFSLPKNREVEDWVLEGFNFRSETIQRIKNLREIDLNGENVRYRSRYLYEYFPYYQMKIRECITGESLTYLERKLSVFYVHLNILGSMIFAFMSSFVYSFSTTYERDWDLSFYKIGGVIILVVYFISALQIIFSAFHHATEFEHLLLEQACKKARAHQNELKK